jgi:hypothetical protein
MAGLGAPMAPQPQQGEQEEYEDDDETGGMADASEEEQQALQQFVETALGIIYPANAKGQVAPQVLDDLRGNIDPEAAQLFEGVEPPLTNSPQDAVSATAVVLSLMADQQVGLLQRAMEEQGGAQQQPEQGMPPQQGAAPMPQQQPMPQGQEMPEGEEDDFSAEAVFMEGGKALVEELITISEAAKLYDFDQEEVDGVFYRAIDLFRVVMTKMNPQMIEQLGQQFGQVVEANKAGTLNKILPGLPGGGSMQKEA